MFKLKIGIAGEITEKELLKLRRTVFGTFPRIKKIFPISEIYLIPINEDIKTKESSIRFLKNTPSDSRTLLLTKVQNYVQKLYPYTILKGEWYAVEEWASLNNGCVVFFRDYEDITYVVITHGLGHAFGLSHCDNKKCVMFIETTSIRFCLKHKRQLARLK